MSNERGILIERMTRQIAHASGQRLKDVRPLVRSLVVAAWEKYHDDGAPFGDTADGFLAWLEDRGLLDRTA
jgi:hypothetical protein